MLGTEDEDEGGQSSLQVEGVEDDPVIADAVEEMLTAQYQQLGDTRTVDRRTPKASEADGFRAGADGTWGQMNPAPYMRLLASGGSTFAGISCSVKIIVKLFRKANMNTWKKFIVTKSWKSLLVRICHIKVLNMAKETGEAWSAPQAPSGLQPL